MLQDYPNTVWARTPAMTSIGSQAAGNDRGCLAAADR